MLPLWLVAWHSGRTSVCDQQTFPVLCSTCSSWVTTYVGKPFTTRSANSAFHPFEVDKLGVVSCNWMCTTAFKGAIRWMIMEWRQDGSFHSWINVWVTGKTVWSLITCAIPECIRGGLRQCVTQIDVHFTLLTLQLLLSLPPPSVLLILPLINFTMTTTLKLESAGIHTCWQNWLRSTSSHKESDIRPSV